MCRRPSPIRLVLPPLLAALAAGAPLLVGRDAAAQGMLRGPMQNPRNQQQEKAPPPALPGLQGRRAPPPIPADPNAGNLSPNEALFDAINRGDLPAAREAVARGANVDAQNVLGLTPIDSAVDQGRTEIMFFLLSVRGTARSGSGPPAEAALRGQPPPAAARRGAAPVENRPSEPTPVAANVPRAPRLWAGDGGSPIPALGFLGFDAGRPAGGGPLPEAERRSRRTGAGRG